MLTSIHQSHLGMFLRCAAQFERRYILGEIIPPGIAARRGSATHKAAEINHLQKLNTREDLPVDTLQDVARDHYIKLVKEEGVFIPKDQVGEKDKLLGAGLDASTRLTKLYREVLAPQIQPIMVEEKIEIDVGLELPLVGTVDLTTEGGNLEDIKTADKSKDQSMADTSLQLTMYAGLYATQTGKWPKKINLRILVNSKKPQLQTLETQRGPEDWNRLIGRIQFMIAQINSGLFPPCSPDSYLCSPKWCGYWLTCRWGGKR